MMENDSLLPYSGYYPVLLSVQDRVCMVVGGGAVGERKIRMLVGQGATVRLAAREMTAWVEEQCAQGVVQYVGKTFRPDLLEGADLVFAATSDAALNREVAEESRRRHLWCNMATDPEEGSFIVPSSFQRGPLTIAVSTAGLSPALARKIRIRLAALFGPEWDFFLTFMGRLRKLVQSKGLETSENQRIFREVAELPLPEWVACGNRAEALQAVSGICGPRIGSKELTSLLDEVWKQSSLSSPPCATAAERSDT
ncbi:MAG: bifunctional precorrin-2 dehydrogenase/sirohydrochlorin ferrochelatase [Syntrophobacteraceae bacterium]